MTIQSSNTPETDAALAKSYPHSDDYPLLKTARGLERSRNEAVRLLRPFALFSEQWEKRPIGGIADAVYSIHSGTEYSASLKLSDCNQARAFLAQVDKKV